MDWDRAIERNREALKRVLAALVAMAGFGGDAAFTSPLRGSEGRAGPEPAQTLPRNLRNAILRLLRPAESATRRLVIVMARGLTTPAPEPRKACVAPVRKPRQFMPVMPPEPEIRLAVSRIALPLLDPARRKPGRRWVRQASVPHIGFGARPPARALPSHDDPLDARRLAMRLDALAAALDDLPGQAQRFARWQARRQRERHRIAAAAPTGKAFARGSKAAFRQPLRWGRPPGLCRRAEHEVHALLADLHALARDALEAPDTS